MRLSLPPLAAALLYSGNAFAQTSTYFSPGVPTAKAVPGDYTGDLRPQVHFSPPQNFMNDPNGMFVDADGLWHLYYQYNPTATVAGNQHWGHATSRDLYTWENQKIALWPPTNDSYIFSGSCVVDVNSTSGFFPDQDNGVVAIYTLAGPEVQTQDIAYSRDGGYTFEFYSKNPVIDVGSDQFRDPKVIWHAQTQRWAMVVAFSVDFVIGIYTSPNLIDWTHASNFSHHGLLGLQYECPNLVEMPMEGSDETMFLMQISINPGAPLGGSISEYFPGSFNGTHFTAVDAAARINDFGKDNYAGQFFYGVPGDQKQVSISWASNWQYTQSVPTGPAEGWRSVMSIPRYNYLTNVTRVGWTMISEPYDIEPIISRELAYNDSLGNGSVLLDYSDLPSRAIYFEANITGLTPDSLTGTLNFTFSSSVSGEFVRGGTIVGSDTWLDRGHTDAFENPFFAEKVSQTGLYSGAEESGSWTISGVIDRTIIEIFVNGGELSATQTFYPDRPLDLMWIGAAGIDPSASVSVGVWGLEDAWAMQANGNGTVVGGSTKGMSGW